MMARPTVSDVIQRWHDSYGGGYGLYDHAPQYLLDALANAGFAVVRVVTSDDLAGDDD